MLQPNGAATATVREGFARLLNDPATQTLSVPSTSRIEWLRGGTSPEAQEVRFDLSIDNGATYTALGSATRSSGGWEMTGLSLPANGQIRARARITSGVGNASAGLLQAIVPVSGPGAPELIVSGNSITITNGAATPGLADFTDFGPVVAAYGSSARTFTIENAGSANLTLGTVTLGGANAADFSVTIAPNPTVVAGASTALQITFDPAAVGPRTATVSFTSNDSDEGAFSFSIQGLATLPTAGTIEALTIPLAVDPNIGSAVIVYATALQPDGKTIIAGDFGMVLGVVRHGIARLNVDGSLDLGFDPNVSGSVFCVAVQADGKVLLGGVFTTLSPNGDGPTIRRSIARVNADGTLDAAFNPNPNAFVQSVVVQPDGKVLLGGNFFTLQPNGAATATPRSKIARVNADGTLDMGFDPKANSFVTSLALQADGKVLLGGSFTTLQPNGAVTASARPHFARVNADGTLDATFDPKPNSSVNSIAVQADGRVLLGGSFTTLAPIGGVGTTARSRIARVNADGTLDAAFDPKANGNVFSITVQTDGQILLGGRFTTLQPNGAATATPRNFLARVLADGTLDAGFDPSANANVESIAVQADGQLLVGGEFTALQPNGAVNPTARSQFAQLNNDPATQTLSVTSAARIEWLRGGTAPEAQDATFELSTDGGVTFTPLGLAARVTGGWELTGLSLPASGAIRARARVSSGYYNGSSSLMETVALFGGTAAAPVITGLSPANQVVILRTNLAAVLPVAFTVTALNATAYQWSVGGLPIVGATAALLSLPDVRRTDGGTYTVTATGPGGSASTNALLQVIVPQQIRSIQKQVDGRMVVRFNDTDGGLPNDLARLEIHSTTNLRPGAIWVTNAGPFTLTTGLLQYEDTAVAGIVRRFYRVIER